MPESLPRPSLLKAKKTGKRRKNAPEQQHETTQKTSKYFDKTKIRIPKQSPDRKRRKVPFAPQKGNFLQPRAANMPTRETFQATGSIPMHEKAPPPTKHPEKVKRLMTDGRPPDMDTPYHSTSHYKNVTWTKQKSAHTREIGDFSAPLLAKRPMNVVYLPKIIRKEKQWQKRKTGSIRDTS